MNNLTPLLRKRKANSRPWSIYIPGSPTLKPIWLPTRTSDELEANRLLEIVKTSGICDAANAMRRDAMTRVYWKKLIGGRNMTVRRAVDDYLATLVLRGQADATVATVLSRLESWIRSAACGTRMIATITVDQVAPCINGPGVTLAYSSRCQQLKILTAFFDWCEESERIPQNPCANMFVRTEGIPQDKLIEKKSLPFTDDEVQRILDFLPRDSWWHGAVLVCKHFGLRLGAVASLEWASLPDLKRLRIFTHKGRVVVDEPLPEEVAAWFWDWPVEGGTGLCFPGVGPSNDISRTFGKYLAKLGIAGKSFRSLRVRVVTNGINAVISQLGGDERALMSSLLVKHGVAGVQKLVGHVAGSGVTAARYFNPQPA